MAIKGGSIIHAGNGVTVIDRIQTAGPGQLNIPTEKIYELGNYKSVATVRDIPDLTFSLESLDVSTEIETLLTEDATPADGIDLATCKPVDIASQFKAGVNATSPFDVVGSVAIPFLYLEQMSYRFGLRDNATQTAQLRGDSIFYNPGAAYVQTAAGSGTAGQTVVTTHPAYAVDDSEPRRILSVTAGIKRLVFGRDYTESYGTITAGAAVTTITITDAVSASDDVRIMYSSPTTLAYPQNTHPDTTVKPAAVKGRDIDVFLGGYDPADEPGSLQYKLGSVQAANVDWRVTIDRDEEFGTKFAVNQDFDVPAVTGSLDIKPQDPAEFLEIIRKAANVSAATSVVGPDTSTPLELHIVIRDPEDGATRKRLFVPDARFTVPGYSGRVQQKLTISLPFESDEGSLLIYNP